MTTMRAPEFTKSPFFFVDDDGWHLRDGAPAAVKAEFDGWSRAREKRMQELRDREEAFLVSQES